MKVWFPLAAVLLLAAAPLRAQPTPASETAVDELEDSIRQSTAEGRASLVPLRKEIRDAEERMRQFRDYFHRMQADASAQRALIALGNLRPYELNRAERNWTGWQATAANRLAEIKALATTVGARKREQEERWELVSDEATSDLSPEAMEAYQQAQAVEKQILAGLTRLETVAQAGQLDAESALAVCNDTLALLVKTRERIRQRFYFERFGISSLPNVWDDVNKDLAALSVPLAESIGPDWRERVAQTLRDGAQGIFFGALLLAFGIWRIRILTRRLRAALQKARPGFLGRLGAALLLALSRVATFGVLTIAFAVLVAAMGSAVPVWLPAAALLLGAVFAWRFAAVFIRIAFDPTDPAPRLFTLSDEAAELARRRLTRLVTWLLVGLVLFQGTSGVGLISAPMMLGTLLLLLLGLRSQAESLRDDRLAVLELPEVWATRGRHLRSLLRGTIVVLIGVAGLGFINLAAVAAWAVLKVNALALVLLLVWRAGDKALGLLSLDPRNALPLHRLWALIVGAVMLVLIPWTAGIGGLVLRWLEAVLSFGIPIGDYQLTAGRLLGAIVVIIAAWSLGRVINAVLTHRVFPRAMVDVGIRDAITTTVGYVMLAAGVLLAIRELGFDLTSLAIVAGALSVGVGFGMQTLVSNFVSGLIILYERPFRIGDILEHEGIMGSVRKIRTRSTIMQTFDEAELVLPNSELLSKRITNWTLSNYRSRVILPIGVAYGSDVELVRTTLLEVVGVHPRLADEPQVFFAAFGDSALEFRVVLWVDIREKAQVVSDVLFSIDKAFREKKIEIPFPQQVVHLRTADRE